MPTNDNLSLAKTILLSPAGLDDNALQAALGKALGPRIDWADIFLQMFQLESWVLDDGLIKDGSFSIDRGIGIRAVSGEKTGFAYTNDIMLPAIEQAAKAAKSIASSGQQKSPQAIHLVSHPSFYPIDNPLQSLSEQEKVDLLRRIEVEAKRCDPRVVRVMASIAGSYEVVMVLNSDGSFGVDIRPLVRVSVSAIVEEKGKRETATAGGGCRGDYSFFLRSNRALHYAREAVRQALLNLEAVPAPAGTMPVVLGPGWPGVLLHEAIGHGLEGDFNRKKSSAFSGRLGERVASPVCTIVDDATLPNRRGSLGMDDEGVPGQYTILIENGILKQYMQDRLNAKLMGTKPTGNGRRESYAYQPIPRMTNTYMLAGNCAAQEIIASVPKGLYAVNFSSGQVDITSGKFVFSTSEAYLIEDGKVTRPVKGATLIGNGPDILTKVSMVGNDLALDEGVGTCGKDGQSVPVGVGQPTLKVDAITVGGILPDK